MLERISSEGVAFLGKKARDAHARSDTVHARSHHCLLRTVGAIPRVTPCLVYHAKTRRMGSGAMGNRWTSLCSGSPVFQQRVLYPVGRSRPQLPELDQIVQEGGMALRLTH